MCVCVCVILWLWVCLCACMRIYVYVSAHGLVRCKLDAGVNACARRATVSLRDVTIARDEEQGDGMRVTSRTGSARKIFGFSKKVRELKQDAEGGGSTFGLAAARRICAPWVPHEIGAR